MEDVTWVMAQPSGSAKAASSKDALQWDAEQFFNEQLRNASPNSPDDLKPITKTDSPPSFDPVKSIKNEALQGSGIGSATSGPMTARLNQPQSSCWRGCKCDR